MSVKTNDLLILVPSLSRSPQLINVDLDDIKFACCEYSEAPVGLTYIDFGQHGAKVYMDVRGGWPAYIHSLSTNDKQYSSGICIAGGSILGLESMSGIVAEYFKQSNYKSWPGINGAVIYSQNLNHNKIYPDKNLGRFAYQNLSKTLSSGAVGAGVSASKGQGANYVITDSGIKILAIVVNNAIGTVYENGLIKKAGIDQNNLCVGNHTTITVLVTNLELDGDELKQCAHQIHCSMAETIRPFNTFFDGDIFYACSTGTYKKSSCDSTFLLNLYVQMSEVVKQAILNSVSSHCKL